VSTEDVVSENVGVEFLGFGVETRESLIFVWNVKTSINSSLHGTEDTRSSGGKVETNIEENQEWSFFACLFNKEVFSVDLGLTNILFIQFQFSESTTSNKQASGISCSIVLLAISRVDCGSVS